MQINAASPEDYIRRLPPDRQAAMRQLRKAILDNIPEGFEETMGYGMIGYVIPHSLYPKGYHCDPALPLPFMGIASQKNHVAVYHMGIYADPELMKWFVAEYSKHTKARLDMGKSCIRFKKPEQIPYTLIGELAGKVTAKEWIRTYESGMVRK